MEYTPNTDFESPGQQEVEITLRDKTAKYIVKEVSGETITELFAAMNNATTPEKKAKAASDSIPKVIATCAQRADGSAITLDEAKKFRFALQKALHAKIMEFNGLTPEADEAAKKD
jgi:hypothetical protein